MSNKRKAEKQVASFEAFQEVWVQAEKTMRDNLTKLIESKLNAETNFDARMAYKIAIKVIKTGTLEDIENLENENDSDNGSVSADLLDVTDGNTSEPQG